MIAYLKSIFDADSSTSFSRYATAATIFIGSGCLVYLVHKNHVLPDGAALMALGAWMTAPYAVNKVTGAFSNRDAGPGTLPSVSATADRRQPVPDTVEVVMKTLFWCWIVVASIVTLTSAR